MDKDSLPLKVDPFRFAENAISLHGVLLIKDMINLGSSLESPMGEVLVQMDFGIDEQGIYFLKGHLDTKLLLQCQRCMNAFDYAIITDFVLGVVHSDSEASQLPGRYDPVIVQDNALFLRELVEQELIVNLPIVPMHNVQDCNIKLPFVVSSSKDADAATESPFKVIELLRHKRNTTK